MDEQEDETAALVSSVLGNFFLFLLILGMAGTTDLTGFREKLRNYKGIGCGLACQFFLLPFLGFTAVKIFGLPQIYGVMLLIVTSSPGGGFSGWWCSLCNADLALSVAMTTVSTMFSIAMLPLNIFIYVQALYGLSVPLNWGGIMTSVAVVIAGVGIGLALGTKFPQYKRWFNRLGTAGGLANIAVGIATGSGSGNSIWEFEWWWYVGIAWPCVIGLGLAFILARGVLRCSGPESVAICIECCYQNTALAIAVAVSVFSREESTLAILVPLYYGVIEILLIALFALIAWQSGWTYASRKDNLFVCISGNYQPGVSDEAEQQQHLHETVAPAPAAQHVDVVGREEEGQRGKDDVKLANISPRS
jgi:sodium/bile acid cotransporter 2